MKVTGLWFFRDFSRRRTLSFSIIVTSAKWLLSTRAVSKPLRLPPNTSACYFWLERAASYKFVAGKCMTSIIKRILFIVFLIVFTT